MSKNRNRSKLLWAKTSSDYNKIQKNIGLYCRICVRRAGSYKASCHPTNYRGWKRRMNRNWKNNRNTKWKN